MVVGVGCGVLGFGLHALISKVIKPKEETPAPVQVVVASITDSENDYAEKVARTAEAVGLRVERDFRNEKISYKVREHSVMKVPFILAVGGREAEAGTVALRRLGSNEQQVIDMAEALATLKSESLAPDMVAKP